MIRNGVELKKDYAVIYVPNGEEMAVMVKVSLEQLELLQQVEGRVRITNNGAVCVASTNGNHATLKLVFYGYEDVEYVNGNRNDLRPENIKIKKFDFSKLLEA